MQVNRSLPDKAMDHIDHALGRPLDPLQESYRNYFAAGQSLAIEMGQSPYWCFNGRPPGDNALSFFSVTDAGRAALAEYLKQIGDPHRAFIVSYQGTSTTVVATSRSKARRSYYLDIADVMPDLTYGDFLRKAKVHVVVPLRKVADEERSKQEASA
ncbi:hypothetical protein [Rhodopseudomonas palustris]|uniref:hypothetical protein n=1 Tax=Rhodopseudomonas palustris TaxID=1076 RepID=UPI000CECDBDC|nr:hypothetical protein [Rhodopseudomonas palustris]PPQ42116.1 hypothetical protein CKO39_18170 [Rhodopseudomonas palustris]